MGKNTEKRNQQLVEEYKASNGSVSVDELSDKYHIKVPYVKQILKNNGIEIGRKTKHSWKKKKVLQDRDTQIIEMYNNNVPVPKIAEDFNIGEERVNQILRAHLGNFRLENLFTIRDQIRAEIKEGASNKDIVAKYGLNTIKKLHYNLKFSPYKEVKEHVEESIVQMYENNFSPQEIADHVRQTRYWVYRILHKKGYKLRLSDEEKEERDREIIDLIINKNKDIKVVADQYGLTQSMVRYIKDEYLKNYKSSLDLQN